MWQKINNTLSLIILIFLSSCSRSIPNDMPYLGVNINELDFNKYVTVSAPKQLNDFKIDNALSLEIVNISAQQWYFNITEDILIFEYDGKAWTKISDKMINLGETALTLDPKGGFPFDSHLVGILPEIMTTRPTYLRIVLLAHGQSNEEGELVKGAFLDVLLRP